MAVSSALSAVDSASAALASKNKIAKDLDSFLVLLTSQLKNQDPLSPMDSTEFTNQLVQFAQVEQQIHQNENLSSLLFLTEQSLVSNAVNYIGKTIEGESSDVPMQDGKLRAAYGVTSDAYSVTLVIRDSGGNIVHSAIGEKGKGVHEFLWDGKDSSGKQYEDGVYTLSVTAVAADETPIDSYVTAFGRVTGVTSIDGRTILLMDGVGIPLEKILSVSESKTASQQPDPEGSGDGQSDPEEEA